MAIVSINYDCGCGYHARTVEEAIAHVDGSHHTLNVVGIVKSSERKVRKAPPSAYASKHYLTKKSAPAAAPLQMQAEDKIDFSNLRSRLQGKQEGSP